MLLSLLAPVANAQGSANPAAALATQLLAQARQQVEAGQPEPAYDLLERLRTLAAAPPRLRGQGRLLQAYLDAELDRPRQAAERFAEAAADAALDEADRRRARLAAGALWLGLEQAQRVVALIDTGAPSADEQALLGQAHYRLQDFAAAGRHLRRAIAERLAAGAPVLDLRRLLLAAQQREPDWPGAARTLRELLAEAPRRGDWWRLLGDVYWQLGQAESAAAAWQTALQTGLDDPQLRRALAQLYLSLSMPHKALQALRPQGRDPAQTESLALIAQSLELARRPQQALAYWQRLAERGALSHRLAYARLLSRLERWEQADQAWQALAEADGLSADDRLQAAVSAHRNGRTAAAVDWLSGIAPETDAGRAAAAWLAYLRAQTTAANEPR